MVYVGLRGAALFRARNNRFATTKDLEELSKCVQEVKDRTYPDMLEIDSKVVR